MKNSIYILGFLLRHGPLHGYAIKQLIAEDAAHFAKIKLPSIYYHLEQLRRKGMVDSSQEQSGNRPDRLVYTISEAGRNFFTQALRQTMGVTYQSEFQIDALFYFGDFLDQDQQLQQEFIQGLLKRKQKIEKRLGCIENVQAERKQHFPEFVHVFVDAIFSHHILHARAEAEWLQEVTQKMEQRWQSSPPGRQVSKKK